MSEATPIIDGETAHRGEYSAVFRLDLTAPSAHWTGMTATRTCTAFLVTRRLLLTAAHCLQGITGISKVTNGTGKVFTYERSLGNPNYVHTSSLESGVDDIGYVTLSEDVVGISPLAVYPTTDDASRATLLLKSATLVGYGAKIWKADGDYDATTGFGTKRWGTSVITAIARGLIFLAGAKNGVLPGDSGGPLSVDIDGNPKVVALLQAQTTVTRTETYHGLFSKKTRTREVPDHYGMSVASPLTVKNLCWVEASSGFDIPGVECP